MMRSYFPPLDQDVRRLRDDLYTARRTILELMPEPIRNALETYLDCKSSEDESRWQNETVDKVLALAQPRPAREMGEYFTSSDRAYCPLCGLSAQRPIYCEGYAFPDGLRRHLAGSHNSHPCSVFEAIRGLCREHVRTVQEMRQSVHRADPELDELLKPVGRKRRDT